MVAQQLVAWLCVCAWFGIFELGGVVHHLKQFVLFCEPLALPLGHRRVLRITWHTALFGVFGGQRHDDAFGVVDSAAVV